MAADLHIHVRTPELTDDVMRMFFASTISDSKWCTPFPNSEDREAMENYMVESALWSRKAKEYEEKHGDFALYTLFTDSPNIWIGEVSWLKAALFGDGETFVPSTIERVFELSDGAIIDDEYINSIAQALDLPNATGYGLAKKEDVVAFLEEHRGKEVFTVSW